MVEPRPGRRLLGGALLLGLLLSQPGHALGYFVLYGSRSLALQSQGAHAYFPTTVSLSFQALATLAVGAALLLGLGRLALGRALGLRRAPAVRPHELVLVLAAVQANAFVFQELTETLAAGGAADTHWLLAMLLGAATGQLPVALAAGLLLAWCAAPLDLAIRALRAPAGAIVLLPAPAARGQALAPRLDAPALAVAFPAAFLKRGPPARSLTV